MSKQAFKQFESNDSAVSEMQQAADKSMQKLKFDRQKREFDAKLQELATKAADFYQKYGEDDWRTSLLVNFLDLSLQMQDIIEVITAFNVANEIIFHSMNLMNTSLEMSSGMMMEMANRQTNPIKHRFMMRKAMAQNRKTVKSMLDQMKISIEMAAETAGMYEKMSGSISGIMNKMNMKREKSRAKNAQNTSASTSASGRGMDMVRGILNGQGGSAGGSTGGSYTPPPSAPKSAPSGGDTGLDGLL